MQRPLIVMIILATFLAGCLPGQNPADVQAQVNTAVAQTMEAQQQIDQMVAQTVAAQIPAATATVQAEPTAEFTSTSAPLIVPTFTALALPTETPIVVAPSSNTGGGSGSPVQSDYSCDVINRRPQDNTEIHHGDKFDIKWMIVNTGTKSWEAGMDVKYSTGPNMTTVTLVEIPVVMKPNDTYQIVLEAVAPSTKGSQVMIWAVQGQLCFPYTAIIVK